MNVGELTEKYIKARDTIKRLNDEHKARVAPLQTAMERVENLLLAMFNEQGIDSCKSPAGTAYRSTRTSATVADRQSFLDWVVANEAWHMLESRCSKAAVEEYVAGSGGDLPPGINWSSDVTINVRRS